MNEKLLKIDIELRSLSEKIKDGTMKAEDAEKRLNELKVEKREIQQSIAQANAPVEKTENRSISYADVEKAMIEKRAITLNGTGAINQVRELFKELSRKKEILSMVRAFYGPNAATNIPVWSPTLATPANYPEGELAVPNDTQAALGNKSITPYAYVSVLPVSAEALTLGTVNLEAELPAIFADAFADAFARGVVAGNGTGRNMKGLFTDIPAANQMEVTGGTNTVTMLDLSNLALQVRDFTDEAVMVMNPAIYAMILADDTEGVAQLYKEELIRNKTIEGVRVFLTGYAPAGGSLPLVVAGRLSDFGLGLASEIQIEPIKRVGDTNTYFQATVFANGTKIVDKNFWALVNAA